MRLTYRSRPTALLLLMSGLASQALGCGAEAPTPTLAKVQRPGTSTPAPATAAPPTATATPAPAPPTATPARPAATAAAPSPTPRVVPTSTPALAGTPGAQGTPVSPRPPENLRAMSSPDYAAQVFLWGSPYRERDLKMAKEAGLRWVKQSFEWRYLEPHVKGQFDWGEPDRVVAAVANAGLKLVARVDNQPVWARAEGLQVVGPPEKLGDFGDFIGAVASRYRGKIQAYEIWNEPNLPREWGNKPPDAKGYVELLKVAYRAIKAVDPDAVVISAGLAPTTATGLTATPDVEYLKQMYQAGLKGNADMLGVHAPGFKAPPEVGPDDIAKNPLYNHGEGAAGRIYCFRHVEDLRQVMVEHGDADRRIAVLEMGWTSDPRPDSPYKWHGVTEQEKADYLVRAFQFARANWAPWIGVMSVIYIAAPHWTPSDEQYYWCITNPDGTVRPAYTALSKLAK